MTDVITALKAKAASDPQLRQVLKRVEKGVADFKGTSGYSLQFAHLLGRTLSDNVLDIPADVREAVTEELLRYGYDDINAVLADVQTALDSSAGIRIRPQKADFPLERVQQFAHSLIDPTVADSVIKRRARAGSETITKSFHDSFIKKNAAFRNDAGLTCYIIREGSNCCQWCSDVAGKYKFGTQPSDIFRRHDNCDCTIIYDGQVLRGKQNADGSRSKTWEEVPDADGKYAPTVHSENEGRAIEQRNLQQYRGLVQNQNYAITPKTSSNAYSVNRDIVNSKAYHDKFENLTPHKAANESLYQQSKRLLEHRDGHFEESLIVIDSRTGKVITDNFSNIGTKYKTGLTEEQYKLVQEHKSNFIMMHNHPDSLRPSGKDIITLWKEERAYASVIVGHDGTLYMLSEMNRKIPIDKIYHEAYNEFIENGFPKEFAAIKATDKLYETNAFVIIKR